MDWAGEGGGGVGGLGTGGGGGGPGAAHLTQWILYSVLNDAGSGKGRATREPRGVSAAAASQMMNREQVRMVHEVSAGTAGAIWAGGRWTRADVCDALHFAVVCAPCAQLLRCFLPPSCTFPALFDELQQCAEQQAMLDLDDAALDDVIPIATVSSARTLSTQSFASIRDPSRSRYPFPSSALR